MYRCELCHEWLHSLCLPKRSEICCKCMRSRRPPLSSVIPLLVELQDQKLHIQEGDSLQALVERVVRWQNDYKMAMQKLRNNDDSQDDQVKYFVGILANIMISAPTRNYLAVCWKFTSGGPFGRVELFEARNEISLAQARRSRTAGRSWTSRRKGITNCQG